ncbi:hypothetical protein [Acinetobacter sp. YH12239]|uniref:hypothetical protein n=1 Tax=Acinetobacter sp. YH12239 TaxID=2601166 RepID=UPI0015D13843|nr:hypothetical protein [Acinetobacter sp. YH12239]
MVDVNQLNNIFKETLANNKKPERILIGYKLYAELMKDRRFFEEVVGSAMNPSKRTYQNIKIKVTQDDRQLELKSSG